MSPEAIEMRGALAVIGMCAGLIKEHDELFQRFIAESESMDSVGPILDPTLWMKPERQKVDAALRPLVKATRDWLAAVDHARGLVVGFRVGADDAADGATTGARHA